MNVRCILKPLVVKRNSCSRLYSIQCWAPRGVPKIAALRYISIAFPFDCKIRIKVRSMTHNENRFNPPNDVINYDTDLFLGANCYKQSSHSLNRAVTKKVTTQISATREKGNEREREKVITTHESKRRERVSLLTTIL